MVKIRLSRGGVRNNPFYRVVAVDGRKKAKTAFLEILGTYFPAKKSFKINREKVNAWVKKGAKVSETVEKLLKENK